MEDIFEPTDIANTRTTKVCNVMGTGGIGIFIFADSIKKNSPNKISSVFFM